jgi:hypothetical protein
VSAGEVAAAEVEAAAVEDGSGELDDWPRRKFETLESPDSGRPVAAPLERCAELLGVEPVTVERAARSVEPYWRADGRPVWSLAQLARVLGRRAAGTPWRAENRRTYRRAYGPDD